MESGEMCPWLTEVIYGGRVAPGFVSGSVRFSSHGGNGEKKKELKGEKMNMLKRFIRDESGLELSEYAVMVGLIVIAVIVIVTTLGTHIATLFGNLDAALP